MLKYNSIEKILQVSTPKTKRPKNLRDVPLHFMMLPAVVLMIVFHYLPMYGIIVAFQDFNPFKGFFGDQTWIGLDNFKYIAGMPDFLTALRNTFSIAVQKLAVGQILHIFLALMLNEINHKFLKRSFQTAVYLPHFLSWVILGGIMMNVLSPTSGIVGQLFTMVGVKPIYFLGDERWFQFTLVLAEQWKNCGWGTILLIAAITGIDPSLYEAAIIDGANRWKQAWHVTLPGIRYLIVLSLVLSMGHVLNAGFEQIFILYSPSVYSTGDIIDTLTYRLGLLQGLFGVSTAVGLFKSLVSFVLTVVAYWVAYKTTNYRVF